MNKENKNVFEETVETLTNDVLSLQQKFHRAQEKGDIQACINCLRLLKDTLSLIKEYDWELKYSEYKTDRHKEVAVWEQNHSGEIRNHKKWTITESSVPMYIDFLKDKALVFFNKERYLLDYKPLAKNGHIPLIDFINIYGKDSTIYVDRRGFGLAIADLLDSFDIPYYEITCRHFLNTYYSE